MLYIYIPTYTYIHTHTHTHTFGQDGSTNRVYLEFPFLQHVGYSTSSGTLGSAHPLEWDVSVPSRSIVPSY